MKKFYITPKQMCKLYIYITGHKNIVNTILWRDGFSAVFESNDKLIRSFWSFKYKENIKAYQVSSTNKYIEKWVENLIKNKNIVGDNFKIEEE